MGNRTPTPGVIGRIIKTLAKVVGTVLAVLLLAAIGLFAYRALSQRGTERARIVTTPDGISQSYAWTIRGRQQWIEIRGEDRSNPVLLMVHGGPGAAMRPWGYTFQTEWEKHFTIVHWDQRCGGRTFALNRELGCGPLSLDELTADGVAVIQHILDRLGKEKLTLVAHSWGTMLGLNISRAIPSRLTAYVGSGQIVDTYEGRRVALRWTLEQARQHDNEEAITELSALQTLGPDRSWNRVWPWLVHYGGENYTHRNEFYMVWKFFLSPGVRLQEMRDWLTGNAISNEQLRNEERAYKAAEVVGRAFDVPIFFFLGRFDYNTPFPLARDYLQELDAPEKALVVFENSAHSPMWEEPDRYLEALRQYVLPLAQEVEAGAPEGLMDGLGDGDLRRHERPAARSRSAMMTSPQGGRTWLFR